MTDTGRLREALRLYDEAEFKSEVSWPQPPIVAAARRLLAVEESAVPVKWCSAHACTLEYRSVHGTPLVCSHALAHDYDGCRFSDAVIYPGEPE
jgi:hypothetical protein